MAAINPKIDEVSESHLVLFPTNFLSKVIPMTLCPGTHSQIIQFRAICFKRFSSCWKWFHVIAVVNFVVVDFVVVVYFVDVVDFVDVVVVDFFVVVDFVAHLLALLAQSAVLTYSLARSLSHSRGLGENVIFDVSKLGCS